MYLISDNIDTWTGMRLAGVDGAVGHGTGRKPDFITSYVNEAIGLKL